MILYRALTNEDYIEFKDRKKISCTLVRSYNDLDNSKNPKMTKKMYRICYEDVIKKDILSFIYGHTSGVLVKAKRSPWISLTSSFDVAISYSKLDPNNRRYILAFEVSDDSIIKNIEDFNSKSFVDSKIIDLSNNKLAEYRKMNLIIPYESVLSSDRKGSNFTISNYATNDKEYLICYELNTLNYVLLSPLQQDKISLKRKQEIEKTLFKSKSKR